jgi:hypothetical protein
MNNPEQIKLASFKDLMEAKMEREKREIDVTNSQIDTAPKLEIIPKTSKSKTDPIDPVDDLDGLDPVDDLDHLDHLQGLDRLSTQHRNYPVSAAKDYSKLPNSIKRAIKQGIFQGCSLQIYLYLFSLTRGAIQPKRTVRTTKPKIKVGAGVGSDVTLNKHLNHLKNLGYLAITEIRGQYHGNEYEVFIPEEVTADHLDHLETLDPQKLDRLDRLESRPSSPSQTVENNKDIDSLRLSLKTNTKTDDELSAMFEVLRVIGKGKQSSWRELGELLKTEFETARSRTDSVSDAPAFLAEHLRRRLAAKPQRTEKAKPFEPGKDEPIIEAEVFTPEPLSEQGREVVLNTLRRMAREEANGYQDHYTAEDWEWLVEKLD